jgi:ComF family protein
MKPQEIVRTVRAIGEGLLDIVYPPQCLLCERWNYPPLCEDCYLSFTPIPEPICPTCGRPITPPVSCHNCADAEPFGGWGFDAARAGGIYVGALREGVHKLKFGGQEQLGELLGAHLANRCVVDALLPLEWRERADALIPVPLHPKRQRQRGFNQAALLAKPLAAMLGKPLLTETLQRTIRNTPQVGLSGEARRRNLTEQGFHLVSSTTISGKHLLLIDDVFTTGTTVSTCARVLKTGGAASVVVVTLAAGG